MLRCPGHDLKTCKSLILLCIQVWVGKRLFLQLHDRELQVAWLTLQLVNEDVSLKKATATLRTKALMALSISHARQRHEKL